MANSPNDRPASKRADHSRPPKPRSKSRRSPRARLNRTAPLHQARVFAMQALYEVDVTGHSSEEIQQHLGTSRRRELETFFQQARRSARSTLATIAFLARSTDRTNPEASLATYQQASQNAVDEWIEQPAAEDADIADVYTTFARDHIEGLIKARLQAFRDQAASTVSEWLAQDEQTEAVSADERELQEDLGGFVDVADRAVKIEQLEKLEQETLRQIEATLGDRERAALDALLDMLRHAERLTQGVAANQAGIDERISVAAPAFPIDQLASIDRAVLRIAVQELLHEPDVPFRAVVNEAVEIAKQYGGPNSGRFVNGVLRTISERVQAESGGKSG